MELGKDQQQEVILRGFSQPQEEQRESIPVSTLLRRYKDEDLERRKHKTCYLNDVHLDRWLVFLAEHYPKLTYGSFNKKVVEHFVQWRKKMGKRAKLQFYTFSDPSAAHVYDVEMGARLTLAVE